MGIKLLRISDVNGWDCKHAVDVLNFPGNMDTVIAKLEEIIRARMRQSGQFTSNGVPNPNRDIFSRFLKQMRCLKNWSESLHSSNSVPTDTPIVRFGPRLAGQEIQDSGDGTTANGVQPFSEEFLMDMSSDNYLWEMLGGQDEDWMTFGS